ncbi:MAG: Ig domain-containing protein [Clostridia bacterium]|nr:Ig domain-containing protein [Clostridia bacterium]
MNRKMKWIAALCLVLIGTLVLPAMLPQTVGTVAAAASVKLNKTSATVKEGETLQLKMEGVAASKKITWKSSDKTVATVDKNGKVKGKKAGTATITAKVSGKKYTCKVTVKAAKKENAKSDTYDQVISLKIGESKTFRVKFTLDKAGSGASYNFKYSKSGIISLNTTGGSASEIELVAYGKEKGTIILTVSNTRSTKNKKIKITVK